MRQRVRDRPPARHRRAGGVEHRGGQRVVRLEPHERVEPEARRPRPRAQRVAALVGRASAPIAPRLHVRRTIWPIAAALAVSPMRPSASAARPRTSGDGSCKRRASAAVRRVRRPMRPRREGGHLRARRDRASASSADSGPTPSASPTRPIASAARRRIRGVRVRQQRDQVGRRRRRRGAGGRRLLLLRAVGSGDGARAAAAGSRRIR